jgi:hypothetical protein
MPHELGYAQFVEYLFQCRSLKTVGILLHDNGTSGAAARIRELISTPGVPSPRGRFLFDDVLNVDDRMSLSLAL